ncbi:MAG: HEAT repeat domain-containing protein [Waddliaceae bacterium]
MTKAFRISYWTGVFFLFFLSVLCAETAERKVYAFMTIKDYRQACEEAKLVLDRNPQSKQAWEAYIHALARFGEEKQMVSVWENYLKLYPEEEHNRHLLESMAWGVIEKAEHSASPIVRTYALLGAFIGADARGVEILHRNLFDPCASIRAVSLRLVSNLRDADLQEGVFRLFQKERNGNVRLEAIKAVGEMKIQQAQPGLVAIVADGKTRAEEKAAAMESLVRLLETPKEVEIEKLAKSNRAGLRELACQVVAHAGEQSDVFPIIPLLRDHCADVRCAALQVLGLLRVKEWKGSSINELIFPLLDDPSPQVAVTAAWAFTLNDPDQGRKAFGRWLTHQNREVRLMAGAALVSTGSYGYPLLRETFYSTEDPYLKMNLALGLVAQREECQEACEAIYQSLTKEKALWKKEQKGLFRFIAPSKTKHSAAIPNQPEETNQLTRLEVLNVLAVMEDPNAQPAIRNFLQERTWGVSGVAAALLLTEGDELALQHVQELLGDSNNKVRIQAALILALWGRGEGAIKVLQEAYDGADREMKERLLEGIGHIGARSSISFLTKRLKESYQTLRIIAAASLLKCLYH